MENGDTTLIVTPKYIITVLGGRETLHFDATMKVVEEVGEERRD